MKTDKPCSVLTVDFKARGKLAKLTPLQHVLKFWQTYELYERPLEQAKETGDEN